MSIFGSAGKAFSAYKSLLNLSNAKRLIGTGYTFGKAGGHMAGFRGAASGGMQWMIGGGPMQTVARAGSVAGAGLIGGSLLGGRRDRRR